MTAFRLVSLLAFTIVPFAALAQGGLAEVRIENVSVTGNQIRAELVNRGSIPLTAWVIELRSLNENGNTMRSRQTTDVNPSTALADLNPAMDKTLQTQTRMPVSFSKPAQRDTDVRFVLIALVRADGTADGDQAAIEQIFSSRTDDLEAARAVLQALRGVSGEPAQQALARARSAALALRAAPQNASTVATEFAEQVSQLARSGTRPDVALQMLTLAAERRFEAAQKHSRRRAR